MVNHNNGSVSVDLDLLVSKLIAIYMSFQKSEVLLATRIFNKCLKSVASYSKENGLMLNLFKSAVMFFSSGYGEGEVLK